MPQSLPAKIEDEVKMLSAEGYWREKILEKCVELKRKTTQT